MTLPRRWFQYSLRSFFILLTVLTVWLGVVVHRARAELEAIKAIEALGGTVYDYELEYEHSEKYGFCFGIDHTRVPPGPEWLRRMIGEEFFQNAEVVFLGDVSPEANMASAIPYLRRLRTLRFVLLPPAASCAATAKFKPSLPGKVW